MILTGLTILLAVGTNAASDGYLPSSSILDHARTNLDHSSDSLASRSQENPPLRSSEQSNSQDRFLRGQNDDHRIPVDIKSLSKPNTSITTTKFKYFGTPVDVRPKFGDRLIDEYVPKDERKESIEDKGYYPNAKAIKTHYEAPQLDLNRSLNKRQFKNVNIQYWVPKHIENTYGDPNKETVLSTYDSFHNKESPNKNRLHREPAPYSMRREYSAPQADENTYGVPKLFGPNYAVSEKASANYRTPEVIKNYKSVHNELNTDKSHKEPFARTSKAMKNKYGPPKSHQGSRKATYASLKSLNGPPKSFNSAPRSLESNYNEMYSTDQTYGAPKSHDTDIEVPEQYFNEYSVDKSDKENNIDSRNYRKNGYHHQNAEGSGNIKNVEPEENNKIRNSFAAYNSDYEDVDTFREYNAVHVENYTEQVHDQQFEDSRSFSSHKNYDFDPSQSGNNDNFRQFHDIEDYSDTQYVSNEYGVPASSGVGFSGSSARTSPGITGVTQAIIISNEQSSREAYYPHTKQTEKSPRIIQSRPSYHHFKNEKHTSKANPSRRINDYSGKYAHQNHGHVVTRSRNSNGNYRHSKDFSGKERNSDGDANKPTTYNFEYTVSDYGTENDFGHSESRKHARARGSYHVLLPDGRKQIVQYEADENGFKPTITYEDPAPSVASSGYELGIEPNSNLRRGEDGYDGDSEDGGY